MYIVVLLHLFNFNRCNHFLGDSSSASEAQYSLMQFLSLDMTGKVQTKISGKTFQHS